MLGSLPVIVQPATIFAIGGRPADLGRRRAMAGRLAETSDPLNTGTAIARRYEYVEI